MTTSLENTTSLWYLTDSSHEIASNIKFCLFLISDICALLCTIFVLYHLLTKRHLRNALHNHIPIIILLLAFVYQSIDIPFHLEFFHKGKTSPSTPSLCLIWWFIDWGFYYTIAVLLVFASFERHILIFQSQLVTSKRKRWIFHYLPILTILILMSIFYSIAIFAPICESVFDYTSDLCGTHACYGTLPFFMIVEQLIFGVTSILLIALFNMALLVRVIRQKHRVHGIVQWKKQRKLAIQMIALSLLYTTFTLPLTIVYTVRLFSSADWGEHFLPAFFFLSYYTIFLLPYVCLTNVPDLGKIFRKCTFRSQARVGIIVQNL